MASQYFTTKSTWSPLLGSQSSAQAGSEALWDREVNSSNVCSLRPFALHGRQLHNYFLDS